MSKVERLKFRVIDYPFNLSIPKYNQNCYLQENFWEDLGILLNFSPS